MTNNSLEKFKELLKKIFQFETSDLDFGIYRILNYKREQINKFIEEDLTKRIEEVFKKHKENILANIEEEFEKAKKEVIEKLGKDAFTPTGELKEEFKNTPLGRKFLSLKNQKEEVEKLEEIKSLVYSDLYNFFSRYYEEGDFIPQYRYSIKNYKYAIPYNGEEVKLYWVNYDQYYIKTGLLFRDYTFKLNDFKIIFRTVEAKEELGSNKATKQRYFILDDEKPIEFDKENKILIIRFQYRELTEEEVKEIGKSANNNNDNNDDENDKKKKKKKKKEIKQEVLNSKIEKEILEKQIVEDIILKELLSSKKDEEKTILLYHLNRFTAKNTKDYFIHKDLKRFLTNQLDYFIKSEVLSIETIEEEKYLDKHITRAKAVKEIGETIIEFLSQLENFQKRLWEKKKFVLKTEYVITTDRVPEEFYEEIWNNEKQKKEWEGLGFEIPEKKEELINNKLPIDTKYFNEDFKERLLERLTETKDLDDLLDGILIKSENWQALNLLLNKYKEEVQTIYIDPPFNKEQDADYLYNVKYKDSTWASMLENRLRLARDLLSDRGSIFVRCDYNGNWIVRILMDEIFGKENFRNEIIASTTKGKTKGEGYQFTKAKDSIFLYSSTKNFRLYHCWADTEYKKLVQILKEKNLLNNSKINEIFWTPLGTRVGERATSSKLTVFGIDIFASEGRHWELNQKRITELETKGKIRLKCKKCGFIITNQISKNNHLCKEMDWDIECFYDEKLIDENWTDIPGYSQTWGFSTENSEMLLKRVIESTSKEGDLVMDFFLGSGTTTAVAHKLKRKWIGVEMGEHFKEFYKGSKFSQKLKKEIIIDKIGILGRMKKVLYYDKSGISKEKDVKEKYNENTAGGFFKYQILEQYEDALDNIELKENKQIESLFKDEYLLKYFLEFETRESPYLLNIEYLKNPFAYKLKVNLSEVGEPQEMIIDIPETFNYLLGIKVKKIKTRKDNGKKYLFILGEKEGRNYAIVWREYKDNEQEEDLKKDNDFIQSQIKDWNPNIVYVNGKSCLTPEGFEVKYIEPEFKKLMER